MLQCKWNFAQSFTTHVTITILYIFITIYCIFKCDIKTFMADLMKTAKSKAISKLTWLSIFYIFAFVIKNRITRKSFEIQICFLEMKNKWNLFAIQFALNSHYFVPKFINKNQLNKNLDKNASTLAYLNHLVETVVCHKWSALHSSGTTLPFLCFYLSLERNAYLLRPRSTIISNLNLRCFISLFLASFQCLRI